MKRVAWLSDLHLNFLRAPALEEFLDRVAGENPDAVLIGGDIAEARDAAHYLRRIADAWKCPVYFVLGNHDFYFGSIARVRAGTARLCEELPHLQYLTLGGVTGLTSSVGLVGHDGWADARLGDYENSTVMLNDYRLIDELAHWKKPERLALLRQLGDAAAEHFRQVLPEALDRYSHVYALTHVPPFREACWHQGQLSDDEWMPHFTCRAVGDAMLEIMRARPERRLTVLCGHTHSPGQARLLPNLEALTAGARYGAPTIQALFELAE
jgi:3',5'-cyclic AMP phosphodiesterase CpdA